MQEQGSKPRFQSDEIDLVELVKGLWIEKWLIVTVTVLITACAALYALRAVPLYETKASVLPPLLSDIAEYNLGREDLGLKLFTVDTIYGMFTRNLASESLRRSFFNEVYLPSVKEAGNAQPEDQLWRKFNEQLTITTPNKQRPEYWEVRVEHSNPQTAAAWANQLIALASSKTEESMQRNVASEIFTQFQVVERQVEALRHTAKQRREDRIASLEEALKIAEGTGLEAVEVSTWQNFSAPEYMRGAKAIRVELELLRNRKSDDPFISELRDHQERLEFLKTVDVSPDNVAVFTLDSAAQVPQTPIKPKKTLIMALGLVLGGMLGVFVALVRRLIKTH